MHMLTPDGRFESAYTNDGHRWVKIERAQPEHAPRPVITNEEALAAQRYDRALLDLQFKTTNSFLERMRMIRAHLRRYGLALNAEQLAALDD